MIELDCDSHNTALVWNSQDWYELRSKHRIVGNLIGTRCSAAKNSKILALPSQLLPEEVTLLLEENICKLVQIECARDDVSPIGIEKFSVYKEINHQEQVKAHKKSKENKVLNMIDAMAENTQEATKDMVIRNKLLQNELHKIEPLSEQHVLVQRLLGDPWLAKSDFNLKQWSYPESRRDILKFSVFKDLWYKNFFITNGNKFGGDYLVYSGDPAKFHAQFIIICKYHDDTFNSSELAMFGRVGSNAKKTVVIASLDQSSQVMYQSLTWLDIVI